MLKTSKFDIARARKINNISESLSEVNRKEKNNSYFIYNILKLFRTADESGLKLSFTSKLI